MIRHRFTKQTDAYTLQQLRLYTIAPVYLVSIYYNDLILTTSKKRTHLILKSTQYIPCMIIIIMSNSSSSNSSNSNSNSKRNGPFGLLDVVDLVYPERLQVCCYYYFYCFFKHFIMHHFYLHFSIHAMFDFLECHV